MRDINLLPGLKLQKNQKQVMNRLVVLLVPVIAIIFISGILYAYFTYYEINYQHQQTEVEALIDKYSIINSIKQEINENESTLMAMKAIMDFSADETVQGTFILDEIKKLMPEQIFSLNLNAEANSSLQLTGLAKTKESIAYFIYNLKNSKKFDEVFVGSIATLPDKDNANNSNYGFTITLRIMK